MADLDATYADFASAHGLEATQDFAAGPLTPLLAEGAAGRFSPAARGKLPGGVVGVVGHFAYKRNATFRFSVALTEVAVAAEVVPRLFCVHRHRRTRDDEFYGFGARYSKLWTESTVLSERYSVSTSPFQDALWLRRLFSPALIDWLITEPPGDFSFELAYGSLLGSVERDDPDAAGLEELCRATAHVAERIGAECEEG